VEGDVEARLQPRRKESVQHVAADVAVFRERIGACHHEQAAVEHVHEVEGPGVRIAEDVSRKDFVRHEEREQEDEPAEQLAYPGVEAIDTEQDALHGGSTLRKDEGRGYTAGRRRALRECRSKGAVSRGKRW